MSEYVYIQKFKVFFLSGLILKAKSDRIFSPSLEGEQGVCHQMELNGDFISIISGQGVCLCVFTRVHQSFRSFWNRFDDGNRNKSPHVCLTVT